MKQIFLILIFYLSATLSLSSQELTADYQIDWPEQQLVITVKAEKNFSEAPLPSWKYETETEIHHNMSFYLIEAVKGIIVDSRTTGEDYIEQYPSVIDRIIGLAGSLKKTRSVLSRDLNTLTVQYKINLYPSIAELFIQHSRTTGSMPSLGFVPSADFSGIVIYVDGSLPMFGKHTSGQYVPSLFPRIFDEEMNLIAGPLMVDPHIIRTEGAAGYQKGNSNPDLARTGQTPMNIAARGIFGINNTDLIISADDAEMILSRQANIDLINKGRIVIIYY